LVEGTTPVGEAELQETYKQAKVDPAITARPSVEAIFHALLLGYAGVKAVAHVHATAVNALTCSKSWPCSLKGRLCPDEAVVLGPDSVFVDYVDPGVELGRKIKRGVDAYIDQWGQPPKVIYMQNHGVIALGASTGDAVNITQMAVKAARIRLGALASGEGINPLAPEVVAHLLGRPDEKYRQKMLDKK
jgi:rhamnose utilization protein RhaD (predicted bifunctional aldolase and dehydrogenase)